MRFTELTLEAGRGFVMRGIRGPVTKLNLIRLGNVADYSNHPELAAAASINGSDALAKYVEHTLPYLHATGGGFCLSATAVVSCSGQQRRTPDIWPDLDTEPLRSKTRGSCLWRKQL